MVWLAECPIKNETIVLIIDVVFLGLFLFLALNRR